MTFLSVQRMWGDLWLVEDLDIVDVLIRLVISLFLVGLTILIITLILIPGWFIGHVRASEEAATLPRADTVLNARSALRACPSCGNTRSLDIRPCIRCGTDF